MVRGRRRDAHCTNLPCICAIVSVLSNRSTPARTNSFGKAGDRNISDSPSNHPRQYCSVRPRSVRQYQSPSFCRSCAGTEIRADSRLRTCPLPITYNIAPDKVLNDRGRDDTHAPMYGSACRAVPSVTSISTVAQTGSSPSAASRAATLPPALCPTSTNGGISRSSCANTARVAAAASRTNVSISSSYSMLSSHSVSPCAR